MSDPKPYLKKVVTGPLSRKGRDGKWYEDSSETVGTPDEGKFGLSVGPIEVVNPDEDEIKKKALRQMVFGRGK
jgi:hypothetical protein